MDTGSNRNVLVGSEGGDQINKESGAAQEAEFECAGHFEEDSCCCVILLHEVLGGVCTVVVALMIDDDVFLVNFAADFILLQSLAVCVWQVHKLRIF